MTQKVLVTGSTKGIGKGILEKFHTENWDVCISGRNQKVMKDIQNNLNNIRGNSAIGLVADLSNNSKANELFQYINQNWGRLDCVVFNIGSGTGTRGIDTTFESNLELIKLNFLNTVNQFESLLPLIENSKNGGSIIFIGSIAHNFNVRAPFAYSYSKRALNIFAKYQALRLARNQIRVNIINPGHILTEDGIWNRRKGESEELFEQFVSENIPLGNIGEVEDIAKVVFNCASGSLTDYLIGQSISIDGGTSILK